MSDLENKTKKQEEENYLKSCQKCTKFFTNQQAYETHLKMKHEERDRKEPSQQEEHEEQYSQEEDDERNQSRNNSKKSGKNLPIRSRMVQIQRNQLEDNIYTFLGQLGQRNAEPITNRAQIINFANDQKLTGQTNYSVNKVIRTPYEEPIKCSQEIPTSSLQQSKHKDFLLKLKHQLEVLEAKVQDQRQTWQLRDPMAAQEEVADEFSLMDIKKMILNYPKRKIEIDYPHFSIFLLWIGRILKAPAFKQFFIVMGQYLSQYYANETNKMKGEQAYENWKNHQKHFDQRKLQPEELARMKIFDEKNCKKFLDYFVQWTQLFRVLGI